MKKKYLTTLLLIVLVAALSVGATLAYLTDEEQVKNTFTVGKVYIDLDEADVNTDGTYVTDHDARVKENEYHLIPGHTYIKDPTIHVKDDTESCYLFVEVKNGIKNIETTKEGETIADQMAALGWVAVPETTDIYVLAKGEGDAKFKYTVGPGAEVVVFTEFTIDGDKVVNVPDGENVPTGKIDLSGYANAEVKVTAYAVQADGFDNSLAAWTATYGK